MEWLFENWVPVLVFSGLAAMHLFEHGRARKQMTRLKPVAIARVRSRAHPLKRAWQREPCSES
ncbi:hypothetical protein SAMN05444007_10184 [Cribrihabitans marinus]|uniref:Uncharacterized protein n=1 Tax=Cribrihabitans marinus TaxID=1227549 RepID=A0A1H6QNT1_9RHOB|nr:hypothetical protein [Cribrihabitans marinus]GGH18461.1 hypothetical protein GCM10010973_01290 [Cribrihabitans marinus]SEI41140.1 hypothetical protein SAMN05444007_10184 [Cribrihabitans marinus]